KDTKTQSDDGGLSVFAALRLCARQSAAFIFIATACGLSAQENEDSARVNEAFKRAAGFLITCQDPANGAIHNRLRNETTMTSLAILSFAAMGHQPSDPTPEGRSMSRALDFVLRPENQDATGYFGRADGSRMYGHGITTLMLAEMLGMGTNE